MLSFKAYGNNHLFLTDDGSIYTAIVQRYESFTDLEVFNFIYSFTKFKGNLYFTINKPDKNTIFVIEVLISKEDEGSIDLDKLEAELFTFIESIIHDRKR